MNAPKQAVRLVRDVKSKDKGENAQVDEAGYVDIARAAEFMFFSRDFEEKLFIVMKNYEELELMMTDMLTRFCIDRTLREELFAVFNQKLLNLLSSIRMYHDHRDYAVKSLFKRNLFDLTESISKLYSEQYDSSFEYRFMEELRNFAQHKQPSIREVKNPLQNRQS